MVVNASALASLATRTPTSRLSATASIATTVSVTSLFGAAIGAQGGLATLQSTYSPPEVYTARFTTSLTAAITSGLRPTVISVAGTQSAFGAGTFSIAIYDFGTDANPVNFEALEVLAGGNSLNWTVITEQGWTSLTHAAGSTVIATVLTPRSITQPLVNHTTPLNTPDPHSVYLRKSSYLNKGDLVAGTGGSTQFTTVPVGPDGQTLVADSTRLGGIKWAVAGIGSVMSHMGDIIVGGVLGAVQRLGIGSLGQTLTVVQNAAAVATPTTGPVCSATGSGGALTNGVVYSFAYAWQTANPSPDGGITQPSPITNFTATTSGMISVLAPAAPAAGLTLVVYGAIQGQTLHQQSVLAPTSTGNANGVTVSTISTSSAIPSATNTTGGLGPAWTVAGTVTSVGLTMPSPYVVSGSPVVGTGGFTVTELAQPANSVHAGPLNGVATPPTYRFLGSGDMPNPFNVTWEIGASDFRAFGLSGAIFATRYAGGTYASAPLSGTFAVGDYVIDQTGSIWVCTVAGTPGTWQHPLDWVQSTTSPGLITNGTIATAGVTASRVFPGSVVSNAILQAGTIAGQTVSVINEAAAANTITFAVAATSNVADGSSCVINGLTQKTFVWDTGTALWYEPAPGGLNNPMTTVGDLIVGSTAGTPARLAASTSGYVLTSAGAGVTPTWSPNPAMNNPMTTAGDMIVGAGAGTPSRIAGGTAGYVLTSSGPTSSPTWLASTGGGGGAGGGGGSVVPIQTQNPTGTNTLTFTVPAGFRNLRITGTARSTAAALFDTIGVRFNTDAGPNYNNQSASATGTGSTSAQIAATQATATTSGQFAFVSAASSLANTPGNFNIAIPNHGGTDTTYFKTWVGQCLLDNGAAATGLQLESVSGYWANTVGITSITLLMLGGNYAAGSTITLWGESDAAPSLMTATSNLIQETILAASQSTITVTNIPQGYKDLRVSFGVRSDQASTQQLTLTFNGDSGGNYDWWIVASGGAGGANTNSTGMRMSIAAGTTQAANVFSSGTIFIPNYAQSAAKVTAESVTWRGDNMFEGCAGVWHPAVLAPITAFTLSLGAGSFVAGTTVRVYGEPSASGGASVGTGTRARTTVNQAIPSGTPTVIGWNSNDTDAAVQHQLVPVPGTLTGTLALALGSQTVTGTGTNFTSQVAIGQVLQVVGVGVISSATLSATAGMSSVEQAPVDRTGFADAIIGSSAGMNAQGGVPTPMVVTNVVSPTSLTINAAAQQTVSGLTAASLNSAVIFPQPGMYSVNVGCLFAGMPAGQVTLQLRLNGVVIVAQSDESSFPVNSAYSLSEQRPFQQWDYVEVLVIQTSGGPVSLLADERTHFEAQSRPTMTIAVPYVLIQDRKAAGTDGGTFTAGADQQRVLNTIVSDTAGICRLTSNQITLPQGTYRCAIQAPVDAVNQHRAWLYNVTDSVELVPGFNGFASAGDYAYIRGRFTLGATKVIEVRHRCRTTGTANGFGANLNAFFTVPFEIYTAAEFWKES